MSIACSEVESIQTSQGEVFLEGPVKAAKLESLFMNRKLTNFRPAAKQKRRSLQFRNCLKGWFILPGMAWK